MAARKTKAKTPKSLRPGYRPPQRKPGEPDPMAVTGLAHAHTDEGIAEREARLREEGRLSDGPAVSVSSRDPRADEIARDIQAGLARPDPRGEVGDLSADMAARMDAVEAAQAGESVEPWDAPDPLKEVAQRHRRPGFAQRFLSPNSIEKKGMRGFTLVRNASGNLVRAGRMLLAEMPREKADRRNQHYRDVAERQIGDMAAQHEEAIDRIARDARRQGQGGLSALKPGEQMSEESIASSQNDPGYAPVERPHAVGVHMTRGNLLERE